MQHWAAWRSRLSFSGFNPHRPFRAGATWPTLSYEACCSSFNPHRPFRAGATGPSGLSQAQEPVFQSSPALSGRCNAGLPDTSRARRRFNPHRPFRAGATAYVVGVSHPDVVSILTGPFGPVQLNPLPRFLVCDFVSILTGPFGPVQLHPSGQDQCDDQFQSSPALSGRCNACSATASPTSTSFNPHRPFRAGATSMTNPTPRPTNQFQSSPALSGRCNRRRRRRSSLRFGVSILTGPFGPVQPRALSGRDRRAPVSILTGPFGPVQPAT